MKLTKLTTNEIEELQPTEVCHAAKKGYILGGVEAAGEIDHAALNQYIKANFGPGAEPYGEGCDGDDCVHFVAHIPSVFSAR